MNREDFMRRLAEAIRPRSPQVGATLLIKMLPLMTDVGDGLFTEASLAYCGAHLPRSPNLMQLRDALNAFARSTEPLPQPENATGRLRREQAERDAFLRRDWDDPAGIMQRIRTCDGDLRFLRVLGLAVGMYAPQHIGLIPPHVLESLARDPDVRLPVFEEIRARGLFTPASAEPQAEPARPRTAYLTPDQIEQLGGRKQRDAHVPPAAADTPSARNLDPDAAARLEAAYPSRGDET